jgi:hypothetical protein
MIEKVATIPIIKTIANIPSIKPHRKDSKVLIQANGANTATVKIIKIQIG